MYYIHVHNYEMAIADPPHNLTSPHPLEVDFLAGVGVLQSQGHSLSIGHVKTLPDWQQVLVA